MNSLRGKAFILRLNTCCFLRSSRAFFAKVTIEMILRNTYATTMKLNLLGCLERASQLLRSLLLLQIVLFFSKSAYDENFSILLLFRIGVSLDKLTSASRFMPARNLDYVTLDMLTVYGEDSGVYSCKAVSEFGEAVTSCTVKCQCK